MNSVKKQLSSSVNIIFLVVLIDLIGFGIVLPLLPIYAKSYGASPFVIGLLAISFSVSQLIFNPIWGYLSDRVGRRPILIMSLIGSVSFYTLFGWAPTLTWLFIARTGAGIFAANISTAMAYIADVTTIENRAKGMGLIGAAFGLGFIIGPAIGGFLSQYDYSIPGFGAAVLSGIAMTLAIFKLPESRTASAETHAPMSSLQFFWKPFASAFQSPQIFRPMLVYFFVVFAFSNMQVTFPLYTQEIFHFDVVQNGYVFAFVGLLAVIFQGGLIDRLAKSQGEGPVALFGTAVSLIGMVFIPISKTVLFLLMFMALLGIGMGLNTPTLTSLISISADDSRQGAVIGVSRSLATLGRILGPLWGGWIYGALGIQWPYWSAGFFLLVALIVGLPLRKMKAGKEQSAMLLADG